MVKVSFWLATLLAIPMLTPTLAWGQNREKPQQMDVLGFATAFNSLTGHRVAVTGSAMCQTSSYCLLFPDRGVASAKIAFNPSALTPAEQSQLTGCSPITSPCHITVEGKVRAWSSAYLDATTLYTSQGR
jgi:hypothetical protein